jgi:hypothetical protein
MKYSVTSILQVSDWQALRVAVFGNAQPIFEQFGGGAPYVVEFAEPVTPADLGPLVIVTIIPNP